MATNRVVTVSLRGLPQQVAVWRAAAAHEDIRLSEFLRRAADTYARAALTRGPTRHADT